MKAVMHFDGSSLGNPGPAGGSAVLTIEGSEIPLTFTKPIGRGTSNQAEYAGLILGLQKARAADIGYLEIFGDSQLVVRQIEGRYQVKAPHLLTLRDEARALLKHFQGYSITWIPREQNGVADGLAGWCAQTQEAKL